MNNILFLYSRLNGFVIAVAKRVATETAVDAVRIVYWDAASANDAGNKFVVDQTPFLTFTPRSRLDKMGIVGLILEFRPKVIYISGWMDKEYLAAVRITRNKGLHFRTVCGIDDQWFGTLRQKIGSFFFRAFYRKLFDFMWVAGKPQYHYARMIGYLPENIISNLLSADSGKFSATENLTKRFIFFGRFDRVKALPSLIAAHASLSQEQQREWPLVLIGDGAEREEVERLRTGNVHILPYLQPDALAAELGRGGVGLLTSTFEAWSVGLHELALMGFPIIASQQCGAASEFLVHGYNGYLFCGGDTAGLADAMRAMITLTDEQRAAMSSASVSMAARINPEISAKSLLSLIVSPPLPGIIRARSRRRDDRVLAR